jgi:hypothetical protein
MDDKIKSLMNIPKKHTLRHYIRLVGALYGETEDLSEYIEDRVEANLGNLDGAIDCFKSLLPLGYEQKKADKAGTEAKK